MCGRTERTIQGETFTGQTYSTDACAIVNTGFQVSGTIGCQFAVIDLLVVILLSVDLQLKDVTDGVSAE